MDSAPSTASLQLENRPPVQVAAGQTVLEALTGLEIHLDRPVIAVVNGRVTDIAYCLQPGDQVRMVPQIGGG